MLLQITDLGLSPGTIFEGALITEVVFGRPGLGYTLQRHINSGTIILIMRYNSRSIVALQTASCWSISAIRYLTHVSAATDNYWLRVK